MNFRQVKRHKQLVAGGHEGGMEELKDFVDKKVLGAQRCVCVCVRVCVCVFVCI